jgi:hypothetical protein
MIKKLHDLTIKELLATMLCTREGECEVCQFYDTGSADCIFEYTDIEPKEIELHKDLEVNV